MRNGNDTDSDKLENNTGIYLGIPKGEILLDKRNNAQINYNKIILGNSGQGMSSSFKKVHIDFESEFKELIPGMSGCWINMNDGSINPFKIE